MKTNYIFALLVILIIVGLIFVRNNASAPSESATTAFDSFASCIAEKGAKFYGAYWCPHCQAQKKIFENSKMLPYIECSTPDGKGQTQTCAEAKITGYPTWEFADGSRANGEQSLAQLSEKTECALPELK